MQQRNYQNRNYNRNRQRHQGKRINFDGFTVNEYIKADEVRVIKGNENLGVLQTQKALQMAKDEGLDLVLIAEKASPPVAKIIDFAKFKYQEAQKKQKAKAKSKQQELKEFRIGVNTGENDINIKVSRAKKFLTKKDKVRFVLKFRGREIIYKNLGYEKLQSIITQLSEVGQKEGDIKQMGKMLQVTLAPK